MCFKRPALLTRCFPLCDACDTGKRGTAVPGWAATHTWMTRVPWRNEAPAARGAAPCWRGCGHSVQTRGKPEHTAHARQDLWRLCRPNTTVGMARARGRGRGGARVMRGTRAAPCGRAQKPVRPCCSPCAQRRRVPLGTAPKGCRLVEGPICSGGRAGMQPFVRAPGMSVCERARQGVMDA